MEFLIKIFLNNSGVPLSNTKPRLDGRIAGGNPTTIQNFPHQVWSLCCCSVRRYV